jgi:hypothetical protein
VSEKYCWKGDYAWKGARHHPFQGVQLGALVIGRWKNEQGETEKRRNRRLGCQGDDILAFSVGKAGLGGPFEIQAG